MQHQDTPKHAHPPLLHKICKFVFNCHHTHFDGCKVKLESTQHLLFFIASFSLITLPYQPFPLHCNT